MRKRIKRVACFLLASVISYSSLTVNLSSAEAQTTDTENARDNLIAGASRESGIENLYDDAGMLKISPDMVRMAGFEISYLATYNCAGIDYDVYKANITEWEKDRNKFLFFDNGTLVLDDATLAELAKYAYARDWENYTTGMIVNKVIPAMQGDEDMLKLANELEKLAMWMSTALGNISTMLATGGASASTVGAAMTSLAKNTIEMGVDELVDNFAKAQGYIMKKVTEGYFKGVNELSNMRNTFLQLTSNSQYLHTEDGVDEFFYEAGELIKYADYYMAMIDYVAEFNKKDAVDIISNVAKAYVEGAIDGLIDYFSADFLKHSSDVEYLRNAYKTEKMANIFVAAKELYNIGTSSLTEMTLSNLSHFTSANWASSSPAIAAAQTAWNNSTDTAYGAIYAVCKYTRNHVYNMIKENLGNHGETKCYSGHEYCLFDFSGLNWYEAEKLCESMGGHLATITSEEEQKLVSSLLSEGGDLKQYWLGGTDDGSEGEWRWITGEVWEYSNWDRYMPDNNGDENFLHILKFPNPKVEDSAAYKWNDINKNNSFEDEEDFFDPQYIGFICEWDSTVFGDADFDGKVTTKDAEVTIDAILNENTNNNMDLNYDKSVTVTDVLRVYKKTVRS